MPKHYCAVPVPPALLEALDLVHGIRELQGLCPVREGQGRPPLAPEPHDGLARGACHHGGERASGNTAVTLGTQPVG